MSQDTNTEDGEGLNVEERKIIKIGIDLEEARELLDKIKARTPDASEIDEIHLVIKK
jgi:hypothetical protein